MKKTDDSMHISLSMRAGIVCITIVLSISLYLLANKKPSPEHPQNQEEMVNAQSALEIEILDGSGNIKQAQKIIDVLRKKGFDVVDFHRYDQLQEDKSFIIDRGEHADGVRKIADILGIDSRLIYKRTDPTALVDISIVIGRDIVRLNQNRSTK